MGISECFRRRNCGSGIIGNESTSEILVTVYRLKNELAMLCLTSKVNNTTEVTECTKEGS